MITTETNHRSEPSRVNILGVGVSAINMELSLSQIDSWISGKFSTYICVTGVHGIIESQRNPALQKIHNKAGMVTPDGMPLVWLSRLHGFKHVDRVYGPDLLLETCHQSVSKDWKHFFYGGGSNVVELLVDQLNQKFINLKIVGTHTPPFRPLTKEEDTQVIEKINQANADIVWVGLSTPKQELWMAEHLGKINAPVMIGVGAAFDFHAGLKPQAPRWMQRSGLEWLFRLATEPRRLWKRYLINNPLFLFLVFLQLTGLKKYPLD
jgi:N-acetylglucosaminyldiphosphoundecaprenol N-acetyl-beta-D-mannosaminyltransferase